ncbi:hypothetical protein ACFSTH_14795 [Paenibacillus yanchengensis]|uniref:ABC transporter permease n=1 Tax=Paenibacillus yanchengensis TaxID=2035833 RepID=A0ABW4YEV2_9BACL
MVKQELRQWLYLWKTQKHLLLLPIITPIICLFIASKNLQLAKDMVVFVGFPVLIFPMVALFMQIGSLNQQELFITFPITLWRYAIIRPACLSMFYALLYAIVTIRLHEQVELFLVFIAATLFMLFTGLCIALFKNSAVGLSLSLIILLGGLFTTGSGLGPLYIMQWYRWQPGSSPDQYLKEYIVLIILCSLLTLVVIKNRNKFFLFK